ncbi:MAG: YihY/virulence factor BrkB family protein [Gaiellaceae bacterium]
MLIRKRKLIQKFFADRGTHLAAMIAYFALLSLVPLIFCTLSLLGLAGRQSESSLLVRDLRKIFPGSSVSTIVDAVNEIQSNAATLGIIGGVVLVWTSLSLFSVLESAFNIVYDKPNRPFLHGKAIAFLLVCGSLLTLFVSLLVGSVGYDLLHRLVGGLLGSRFVAYPLTVTLSFAGMLFFLISVYYVLTNERLTLHDVLPGALTAAVMLAATFQVLPIYLRAVSNELVVLRTLGAPVILLVWLYVMANMIVFGAEVNWWFAKRRGAPAAAPQVSKESSGSAPAPSRP